MRAITPSALDVLLLLSLLGCVPAMASGRDEASGGSRRRQQRQQQRQQRRRGAAANESEDEPDESDEEESDDEAAPPIISMDDPPRRFHDWTEDTPYHLKKWPPVFKPPGNGHAPKFSPENMDLKTWMKMDPRTRRSYADWGNEQAEIEYAERKEQLKQQKEEKLQKIRDAAKKRQREHRAKKKWRASKNAAAAADEMASQFGQLSLKSALSAASADKTVHSNNEKEGHKATVEAIRGVVKDGIASLERRAQAHSEMQEKIWQTPNNPPGSVDLQGDGSAVSSLHNGDSVGRGPPARHQFPVQRSKSTLDTRTRLPRAAPNGDDGDGDDSSSSSSSSSSDNDDVLIDEADLGGGNNNNENAAGRAARRKLPKKKSHPRSLSRNRPRQSPPPSPPNDDNGSDTSDYDEDDLGGGSSNNNNTNAIERAARRKIPRNSSRSRSSSPSSSEDDAAGLTPPLSSHTNGEDVTLIVDPALVSFMEQNAACIIGSPSDVCTLLMEENIESLQDLAEALEDEDFFDEALKAGKRGVGVKGFKKYKFLAAIKSLSKDGDNGNESTASLGSNGVGADTVDDCAEETSSDCSVQDDAKMPPIASDDDDDDKPEPSQPAAAAAAAAALQNVRPRTTIGAKKVPFITSLTSQGNCNGNDMSVANYVPSEDDFNNSDVNMVAMQAGVSIKVAREALRESGDVAAAIVMLNCYEDDDGFIGGDAMPALKTTAAGSEGGGDGDDEDGDSSSDDDDDGNDNGNGGTCMSVTDDVPSEDDFNNSDVNMVAMQAGVSIKVAREALRESGDVAAAIVMLNCYEDDDGFVGGDAMPALKTTAAGSEEGGDGGDEDDDSSSDDDDDGNGNSNGAGSKDEDENKDRKDDDPITKGGGPHDASGDSDTIQDPSSTPKSHHDSTAAALKNESPRPTSGSKKAVFRAPTSRVTKQKRTAVKKVSFSKANHMEGRRKLRRKARFAKRRTTQLSTGGGGVDFGQDGNGTVDSATEEVADVSADANANANANATTLNGSSSGARPKPDPMALNGTDALGSGLKVPSGAGLPVGEDSSSFGADGAGPAGASNSDRSGSEAPGDTGLEAEAPGSGSIVFGSEGAGLDLGAGSSLFHSNNPVGNVPSPCSNGVGADIFHDCGENSPEDWSISDDVKEHPLAADDEPTKQSSSYFSWRNLFNNGEIFRGAVEEKNGSPSVFY